MIIQRLPFFVLLAISALHAEAPKPIAAVLQPFVDDKVLAGAVTLVADKDGEHVLLKKPRHPITVRNVLSHTSGPPFKSAVENRTLDMLPLRVAAEQKHEQTFCGLR